MREIVLENTCGSHDVKNRHFTTGQNHYIKPVECNFRQETLLWSLLIQEYKYIYTFRFVYNETK